MLQANELMIGDWLCYEGEYNVQVKGIDFPPNGNSAYISFGAEFYPCDSFSPIPLTPDILEKNGFVEWSDKCYRWEYAEGIYINADFTEEEPWSHISNRCYSATPVCRYVHEFQHALRLCGIEKEIVI